MTDKEYAEKMKEIRNNFDGDEEACHAVADGLLCDILTELGFVETVEVYKTIDKWYA